jgi:hypothetical protein
MTLQELKSNAYDAVCQIELWKQKLNEIQQQINNYKEEKNDDIQPDKV